MGSGEGGPSLIHSVRAQCPGQTGSEKRRRITRIEAELMEAPGLVPAVTGWWNAWIMKSSKLTATSQHRSAFWPVRLAPSHFKAA